MDPLAALSASRQEFESRLRLVTHDQWELPTPCSEWSVRDLVNHMLLGTHMTVQLLGGASQQEVIAGLDDDLVAGSDPVQTFVALADGMEAGFGGEGGLDGTVHHPMGDIPRTMFIGFRIGDNATHAWDLARAIGVPEDLDGDLVQRIWDDLQPMRDMLAASGLFGDGPSGDVGDDAPLQLRYLDLTGRRP